MVRGGGGDFSRGTCNEVGLGSPPNKQSNLSGTCKEVGLGSPPNKQSNSSVV